MRLHRISCYLLQRGLARRATSPASPLSSCQHGSNRVLSKAIQPIRTLSPFVRLMRMKTRLLGILSVTGGPTPLLVIGLCGLISSPALADTKLITKGSPARILVPTSDVLGGTWRSVSFNDTSWIAGQNGVGYEVEPGAYSASVIADSRGDWSTGGRQGENSWING